MNDEHFPDIFSEDILYAIKEITNIPKISISDYEPFLNFATNIRKDYITYISDSIFDATSLISTLPIYNFDFKIDIIGSNLSSYISEINSNNINFRNLNLCFDSLFQNLYINTSYYKQANCFPTYSENVPDENVETEKINELKVAFFNFSFSCQRFKNSYETIHSTPYFANQVLSNFGFSSALAELISLIKPDDPLFTIVTFLMIGIYQEIFKTD